MAAHIEVTDERPARGRLLDPVDRISEILFGLIMAVTFVGSISVATAGSEDVRTAVASALGCNLAWGLVDAVMYVVRNLTERTRRYRLTQRIVEAAPEIARGMIAKELPPGIADLTGGEALDAMRERLRTVPPRESPGVTGRDLLEAVGVFLLVVLATFPVVVPFLLIHDVATAKQVSRGVAFVMLFIAGHELGRHAGHPHPLRLGTAMAVFGGLLILAVIALGG